MAVDSFAKFQAHIADTVNRDDLSANVTSFSPSTLDSTIIRMIAQAEERVGHDIVSRGGIKFMETVSDALATAGGTETVTLPTDFVGARTFAITTNPYAVLQNYASVNALFTDFPSTTTSKPSAYAIVGSNTAYMRPVPDAVYTLRLIYYAKIPALSASNTSNWLLVNGLGAYLGAVMVELCMYLDNVDRLQFWEGYYKQKLNDLMGDDRMVRYSGIPQKPSLQVNIA